MTGVESNSDPCWAPFTVSFFANQEDPRTYVKYEFVVFDSVKGGQDSQIGAVSATVGHLEGRPMLVLDGNGGSLRVLEFRLVPLAA